MENNQEYIKPFFIERFSKRYEFEKTNLHDGISFILDCSFWKTIYTDIYITDYDFIIQEDLEKKGLCMLFYSKQGFTKTQKISTELFIDDELFEYVLDEFRKSLTMR